MRHRIYNLLRPIDRKTTTAITKTAVRIVAVTAIGISWSSCPCVGETVSVANGIVIITLCIKEIKIYKKNCYNNNKVF